MASLYAPRDFRVNVLRSILAIQLGGFLLAFPALGADLPGREHPRGAPVAVQPGLFRKALLGEHRSAIVQLRRAAGRLAALRVFAPRLPPSTFPLRAEARLLPWRS